MFKYKQEIFDALIKVLIHNTNINYSQLYQKVTFQLGKKISYSVFGIHLNKLLEKNIVKKIVEADSKMNIKPIYYSLTEKGKIEYTLGIIDTSNILNKKRALYQLLLFFECYKRNNLISKRRLNIFLKGIGTSFEKLKKVNIENLKNVQKEVPYFNIIHDIYTTFNNVEILEFKDSHNSKYYYYIALPGFSIEEFLIYLQLLKNNIEPRPFAKFPTNLQIP